MQEFTEKIASFRFPAWESLPEIELYMDQVVVFIENRLDTLRVSEQDRIITQAMVNNYVKQGIVPAPVKKKYGRAHLAALIVVCTAKRVLSIDETGIFLRGMGCGDSLERAYGAFCSEIENALGEAFAISLPQDGRDQAERRSVCAAFASTLLAQKLLAQNPPAAKAKPNGKAKR